MVELNADELVFRSPNAHEAAVCRIGFQRTLRIPDDDRDYPLPPGLGRFERGMRAKPFIGSSRARIGGPERGSGVGRAHRARDRARR